MAARTGSVRRLVVIAVTLALSVGGVAIAPGASAVLDGGLSFEEGYASDGARVDDQYRFIGNGGTSGIRFGGTRVDLGWPGETECGGSGTGDYRPTLRKLVGTNSFSFYAHSGARVLESASNNCTAGEFGTGGILFRCTIQCLSVSGFVGLGNQTDTPPTPPIGMTFTASAYDASGAAVAAVPVPLESGGALTPFSLSAPTGTAITFVKIVASGAVQSVLLDDLVYSVDPTALPAYVVSTDTTVATVRPGESTTVPLSVVRSNGSTGTITPIATGLPSGVTATFSPPAFTGTADGSVTMTLVAASNATVGDPVPLTVTAVSDPGAGAVTPTTLQLTIAPTLSPLGAIPTLEAPSCTTQARELSIFVGDGSSFAGQVAVSASVNQPGWSAGVVTSPLAVTNGRVDAAVYWTKDGLLAPFSAKLTVTANPVGRPGDTVTRSYQLNYAQAGLTGPVVTTPPLGDRQVGDVLDLHGSGFCGTVKLKFGNDKSVVNATVGQQPTALLPRNGALNIQTITAATPRLATSGSLMFDRGDTYGWQPGPKLTTTGFRNSAGFAFHNYPVNDLTYQDMTDAFGADQTYSSIDLCFPFGCTVTFRDPVAMVYTAIVRSETVGTSGSGHCYGMSMTAALLRSGGLDPRSYLPYSSGTAFGLTGAAGPSAALDHTIQVNHLKQFGITFLAYWLKQHATNFLASGNDIVTQVRSAIDKHGGAIVTIADHGGGHVVLAHSVEDVGPNEHWIDVYDPNWEYTSNEDSDTTGVEHETRLTKSRIHVVGDSWSLEFPDSTVWSGKVNGGVGSIVVVPLSEARKKQLLPSLFDIEQIVSLLGSLVAFGSTGGSATVTGGPGLLQYGATNWSTSSGLFLPAPTGSLTAPARAGSTADDAVHIAGTAAGTVNGLVVTDGTLVTSALGLSHGSDVTVQKVRGGQVVTSDTSLPSQVTTTRPGSARVSTALSYTAPAGAVVRVAQLASGLAVRSTSPLSLRMRIENRSPRSVGLARDVTLHLPAGSTLTVPTTALRGTGRSILVSIGGRQRTLPTSGVVAGTVSVKALASTRAHSKLSIAAKVAVKARHGARGRVVLVLTRHHTVVATKRFVVSRHDAARGVSVTYHWRLAAPRGLTLRVAAAVAPASSTAGMAVAQRSRPAG